MSQHTADAHSNVHGQPIFNPPPRRAKLTHMALVFIGALAAEFLIIATGALMLWLVGPYLPGALMFNRNYATAFIVFAGLRAMIKLWKAR